MSLRTKLTLMFLGSVQVTFLTALAAFWAVQSWQLLMDDLTMIHEQNLRLERALEPGAGGAPLAALGDNAQTLEETERIATLAGTLANGHGVPEAVRRLKEYYDAQVQTFRDRARFVTRLSSGLFVAIVVVVLAAMLAYTIAIRVWLVRPIQVLSRATAIISTGDLDHRVTLDGHDELSRLGGAINTMAASLTDIQGRLVSAERFAAIGEMSAYVAHNIRNPLASVRATAQSELDDLRPGDLRRESFLDIVKATDRLEGWVANLLRFSSPVTLERSAERLDALAARCIDLARPQLARKGVELDFQPDDALPAVSLDRSKIEQVVSAVITNAIEASPSGGTVDIVTGRHTESDGTASIVVRVGDRGSGIPKERLGKVFTPFSTTKRAGTGLGLSLAHRIVVAHGGAITVGNREGGGVVVDIRLPINEGDAGHVVDPHR